MGAVTLIVGGQKSGKSSAAAKLAEDSGREVVVVAPAEASDDELRERIARHKRDRPAHWRTVETFDLEGALAQAPGEACVVVDALDTWLAHAMGQAGLWTDQDVAPLGPEGEAAAEGVLARVDAIVAAARARRGPLVVVAGQVGVGLHPHTANGRRYVDLHGLALRRLGAGAEVIETVAGRAHRVAAADPAAPATLPEADALAMAARIAPVDADAARRARERHALLAKPPGSLGVLEETGARLAAIGGTCPPPVPRRPALLIAAADHGVHAEGVTPWPREVTAAVVRAAAQGGAVSRALAHDAEVRMVVLDVGVACPLDDHPALLRRPVRPGTRNLRVEDAMTPAEVRQAMDAGASCAAALLREGADILLLGDVGLGNTTPSACLIAAFTGADAAAVTGRGSGADDAMLAHKVQVVRDGLSRLGGAREPLAVLGAVGGLEHAALTGAMLAAASLRAPVLLDGVVTVAAALVACAVEPAVAGYLLAGHRSAEPAAAPALDQLRLSPLLDLALRLGEGSGALFALPLVRAAAVALRDTALLADL